MSAATNTEQDIEPDLTLLSKEELAEIEAEAETEILEWEAALENEMKQSDALENAMSPEQRMAQAVAGDLEPLQRFAERVLRILDIEDAPLRTAKLRAAQAELPQLLKDMNADPASARVIESMMLPALAKGLTTR